MIMSEKISENQANSKIGERMGLDLQNPGGKDKRGQRKRKKRREKEQDKNRGEGNYCHLLRQGS